MVSLAHALAMPAFTHFISIVRSNSAKTAAFLKGLPVGVVMSNASVREMKPMKKIREFRQRHDEIGSGRSQRSSLRRDCVHLGAADGGGQVLQCWPLQSFPPNRSSRQRFHICAAQNGRLSLLAETTS